MLPVAPEMTTLHFLLKLFKYKYELHRTDHNCIIEGILVFGVFSFVILEIEATKDIKGVEKLRVPYSELNILKTKNSI